MKGPSYDGIFLGQTVPRIVEAILRENGFRSACDVRSGNQSADFVFPEEPARNYREREYVAQYQESNLQFLSRLLEHEGIWYSFQAGDEREILVFADSTGAYQPDAFHSNPVPYKPGASAHPGNLLEDEAVGKLTYRLDLIPNEVVLKDYNYRMPSVELGAAAPVSATGFGERYEYGEHFKDEEEGKELARIRAEELQCRERQYVGSSDCRLFRPGTLFRLENHPREDFNRSSLITWVAHAAGQDLGPDGTRSGAKSYKNDFWCISADVPFRPERATPKPRIWGTMHARIDASGDGRYAEVDDQGRYKVQLPLDPSGRRGGKASRWIRMAQAYAGDDMGMQFPLHKGTEVLLTHINGDPDRPIIAAALPNPMTRSPVTGKNQTQSVIRTGGKNHLVFEDTADSQRITLLCPTKKTFLTFGAPPV